MTAVALVGAGAAVAELHGALGFLLLPAEVLLVVWIAATALSRFPVAQPPADRIAIPSA